MNREYSKGTQRAVGLIGSALIFGLLGCSAGDEAVSIEAAGAVDQAPAEPTQTAEPIQVRAGEVSNRLGVGRWEVEPGTDIRGFDVDGQVVAAFHLDNATQLLEAILPDTGLRPVGPDAKDKPDTFTPRSSELYESFRTDLASDSEAFGEVDKVISFRGCFPSVSSCAAAADLVNPFCFSCVFDNTGQFCTGSIALFTGSSPFDCL